MQVVPAGVTPAEVPPRIAIENIAEASFAELLIELGIRAQRMALPGVQDKTSAAMINLPVARAGERFILKLNPVGEYPHLVENEAFFLDAARLSGLTVPPHDLVTDRDGAPGLLVRRFDRITVDGQLRALAVEDGCQAADRPPADKYLLSAERTFAALTAVCEAPALAGRELIRQLAFAYLTGNGDAHAKNFSVLQDQSGEWRISPVYDVPCTHVYGDATMALSIGGRTGSEFSADDVRRAGGDAQRAATRYSTCSRRADRACRPLANQPRPTTVRSRQDQQTEASSSAPPSEADVIRERCSRIGAMGSFDSAIARSFGSHFGSHLLRSRLFVLFDICPGSPYAIGISDVGERLRIIEQEAGSVGVRGLSPLSSTHVMSRDIEDRCLAS